MKKRVLVIYTWDPQRPSFGGVKTIVEAYFYNRYIFEQKGYELALFNYNPTSDGKLGKVGNVIYGIRQRIALGRHLKKEKYDIVHIHTSREFLFLKDILLARFINEKFGLPVAITIHVGKAETVFNRIGFFRKKLLIMMNQHIAKSIFLLKEARKEFNSLGVQNEVTAVLYNFHDLIPRITELPNKQLALNRPINLLYMGAIHREKGVIDLLKGLQLLDDKLYHLDVFGVIKDEGCRSEFENLLSTMPSVVMHGLVSGEKKTSYYCRADVLVLPSYHEGMPMVILEALSAGCAIISTKVGATPEILTDKNAYWIDIQSPVQIKQGVEYFILHKDKLESMMHDNFELAKSYTLDSHIQSLCEIYESILTNNINS